MNIVSIYEFYNRGDEYQKAIYLDILTDIINVNSALEQYREGINKTVNESKGILKKTENFIEGCKKMNAFIYYYKKNQFIKILRDLITSGDEDELIKIRINRSMFMMELKRNKIINEAIWSKKYKNMLDEIWNIEDDEITRKIIQVNNDGVRSLDFKSIQFYEKKFTAFGKTYYLDNPHVFVNLYIPIYLAYHWAKSMGFVNFNKLLNRDFEKEDIEEIDFLCDIEDIKKIKEELSTGKERQKIMNCTFNEFDVYINNSNKAFKLNKTATVAIMQLQFLCYIYYQNPNLKKINQEDLYKFYYKYKEIDTKFDLLTKDHIKIANLKSGLERTILRKTIKDYIGGSIFMITSKDISPLRKN